MFDLSPSTACAEHASIHAPDYSAPPAYAGPECRAPAMALWQWLSATLDEVDYGMVLLSDKAYVMHINHAARAELDACHPLQLVGRELRTRRAEDLARLHDALHCAAHRGLRKLLTLGATDQRVSISVVPLAAALYSDQPNATLVMLGKRQVCEPLSVQGYAHSHALTPAESRVLVALCGGVRPNQIANQLGVAISTVRTQIGNIRFKTGAESIRDLVRQVAVLPPLMGVLRGAAGQATPRLNDAALH